MWLGTSRFSAREGEATLRDVEERRSFSCTGINALLQRKNTLLQIESPLKRLLPSGGLAGAKYMKNSRDFFVFPFRVVLLQTEGWLVILSLRRVVAFLDRRITFPLEQQTNFTIRPPTNDRTCMGWHTRHASTPSRLEGHLRPETLNLTAWNHALGLKSSVCVRGSLGGSYRVEIECERASERDKRMSRAFCVSVVWVCMCGGPWSRHHKR